MRCFLDIYLTILWTCFTAKWCERVCCGAARRFQGAQMQGYWPLPCGFPRGLPAQIWPIWVEADDEFEVALGASTCWSSISPSFSYSQNVSLEEDDVRQTPYFSTKNLSGKSQGFTRLLESETEGKKRKQNHPVFHKSLVSSTSWAKVGKGLQGSPLTKSLFAAPVCTYQKLHKQYLQYFLLWLPHSAYTRCLYGIIIYLEWRYIMNKLKFLRYYLEVGKRGGRISGQWSWYEKIS